MCAMRRGENICSGCCGVPPDLPSGPKHLFPQLLGELDANSSHLNLPQELLLAFKSRLYKGHTLPWKQSPPITGPCIPVASRWKL